MKLKLFTLPASITALFVCSCASTILHETWIAPDHANAPVRKVAILAVDERPTYRQVLESQFARQLEQRGQQSVQVREFMSLPEIRADKDAAAAALHKAGADSILVVRMVDSETRARLVRERPAAFVPNYASYETYGWYDYYSVVLMDMSVTRSRMRQNILLDNSLFDLKTGKRLWSGLTKTMPTDDTDHVAEAKLLVSIVLAAMQKDGVIQ
jgi:hypothetical protein